MASFESVGSILVVAMFVVPPAAAYMLTDRLSVMIALSVVLAALSAILGHIGAIVVPTWFGYPSTTTAGMMAVAAGFILLLAASFGPRHGVLVKLVRRRILSWGILAEDVIALLYRINERDGTTKPNVSNLRTILLADRISMRLVLRWLVMRNEVERTADAYHLTDRGSARAQGLVRSHRLWEQYLVSQAGVEGQQIHDQAERFEHFTDRQLRERLDAETNAPELDPHGRPIPAERTDDA